MKTQRTNKEKALIKYMRYAELIGAGEEDDILGMMNDIFFTAYYAGVKDGKEEATDEILGHMALTLDKLVDGR